MSHRTLNASVIVLSTAGFLTYIGFVTGFIAPGVPRIATTITVLVVLGFASGALMKAQLLPKLGLLAVVPVLHILYEGIDPAKPTLNILVGVIELGCIWFGGLLGHLVYRRETAPINPRST
jgi:hypothetical protein